MPTLTFLPFGMRSPRVRPKIRLFDLSVIINPPLTLNCHAARLTTIDRTRWPQQPSSTSGAPSVPSTREAAPYSTVRSFGTKRWLWLPHHHHDPGTPHRLASSSRHILHVAATLSVPPVGLNGKL